MKALSSLAAVILALALPGCSLVDGAHGSEGGHEIHVAKYGDDGNSGSAERPLRTISAASLRAYPGAVITVHEGTYRERINPPRGGTSDEWRIVYQAAPNENVVIKGSESVSGWRHIQNDTWELTLPDSYFGDFNPFKDAIRGDWYTRKDRTLHTGAV